jgi:hypothetical protein
VNNNRNNREKGGMGPVIATEFTLWLSLFGSG